MKKILSTIVLTILLFSCKQENKNIKTEETKKPEAEKIVYKEIIKDKKIEIQVADAKVNVGKDSFEGYTLTIGKKVIGEIAELDGQFAIIKNGNVDSFYKKLEKAVEILIENYNLAK